MRFLRPEHRIIAAILARMDGAMLLANRCFFGGGTAIVLQNGEYRRSLDVDFLCDDSQGYRDLRSRATDRGIAGLFQEPVEVVRDIRVDQYGIRSFLALDGLTVKFEIVREARIALDGSIDAVLAVPVLSTNDQIAEKLLANADRGLDSSTAHRDAIDVGVLCRASGGLPAAAIEKAECAYGADVRRKLFAVLALLGEDAAVAKVAMALDIREAEVIALRDALAVAARAAWPG